MFRPRSLALIVLLISLSLPPGAFPAGQAAAPPTATSPPIAAEAGPVVVSTDPPDGAGAANPYLPLRAIFDRPMNPDTISPDTFTLESTQGAVSGTVYYDSGRWTAVLDPHAPLPPTFVYTATLAGAIEDDQGNPLGSAYRWAFTTTAVTLTAYHGSLHNHTGYSDGVQDPNAAFTAGRERGLDFMAVTDHSEQIDDVEWEDTLAQAISHTVDGVFVAMAGCEYTNNAAGHTNVFHTIRRPVYTDQGYGYADPAPTLDDFYQWMVEHPEALGQFNHPTWYGKNFYNWKYNGPADERMHMVEVGSGPGPNPVWSEEEYRMALDHAWRVGPTNNGDTHDDQWGIDNLGRSGIWASELSPQGVLEAMRAMRLFATEDGNLELSLRGNDHWMGQTIPNQGTLDLQVYAYDPDGEVLASLILYTSAGQIVATTVPDTNPYTWTVHLETPGIFHYYFARAEQADQDRAVTTPLWVAGDSIVINEFAARSDEWIELYNPTLSTAGVGGWRLTSEVGGLDLTLPVGATLPPNGYYLAYTGGNLLDNSGDVLHLYRAGLAEQDRVGYGIRGRAPAPPPGRSSARAPNGYDRDDDVADWNMDGTPTPGAANDTAITAMGTSLVINEVHIPNQGWGQGRERAPETTARQSLAAWDSYPSTDGGAIEFFNPGVTGISLEGWSISDGDSWATLTAGFVPAHGHLALNAGSHGIVLDGTDVAYLFRPGGGRVDQIGWYDESAAGTFQRICDGDGPHDGYDWITSGGGTTWQDWPESLGATNCAPIAGLEAHSDSPTPLGQPTTLSATVAAGNSIAYTWDLGDGVSGTGPVLTHIYPAAGVYAVVVTATNPVNQRVASTVVTVEEPIAGLAAHNDGPTPLGHPTTLSATIAAGTKVSYTWNLGDGTLGAGPVLTHTYPAVGVYTAVVTATNSVSRLTATTVVTVEEPIAGLAAHNDGPTPLGHPTTLSATITAGTNVSYTWDLEDGTLGTGPVLTHTYPAVGVYTAVVTATNSVSRLTATTVVTVEEPIAGLAAYNDGPTRLGNPTTLSATIAAGTKVGYTWNLEDGTLGAGPVLTHTYPAVGMYPAVVTASNSVSWLTTTTTVTIVPACTPVHDPGMAWTPLTPTLGQPITFTGWASGTEPISFCWELGVGRLGFGASVTHVYTVAGDYRVVLTASNGCGVEIVQDRVTVVAVPVEAWRVYLPLVVRDAGGR